MTSQHIRRSFTEGSCCGRVHDILVSYGAAAMTRSARQKTQQIAAILLALGCVAWGTATAAGAATPQSSNSADRELKATVASARAEGSVRLTVHFFSGKTTGELIEDSGRQSGVETVAIGKERVSIILLNGMAYFSGNAAGLTSYFGLPKVLTSTIAGRWVSVSSTNSGFSSVVAGLTLASALKEASPTGSITEGKMKKVRGQLTASISGTGTATAPPTILFISAQGKHLPVEAVASRTSGELVSGEIATFSRWGEKVHVPTPSNAIPITSLSSPAS